MSFLRLLGVFLKIGALHELEYRVNFYIQLLRSGIALASGLTGLSIIYSHTETLGGWRQPELLALLGVYFLGGGIIGMLIQPSMQKLMEDVRQGTLDFTLTKPEDSQVLVSVRQVAVWKVVDLLLGGVIIAIALAQLERSVGPAAGLAFVVALLAGAAILYAFWLMLATTVFWFVKIDNVLVIFQSMYSAGRWPVGIYPAWLRTTLTFLVPVAFATTVPAEALAGRITPQTLFGAVGLALALNAAARLLWRYGVRHYAGASA
ncbi:MAG TPA: ABC-2 family transporter protein [Chloroflexota bacterium]|jgi:ABC-2 type transport system permease protein|nr:ABC-2 family transporter protein [Chloroflexota bacterium]